MLATSLDRKQVGDTLPPPFLKWAGGKRWLVSAFPELFPHSFNTYIEPFLGSGAVFFHLTPAKAILSDTNAELINTYEAIQLDWRSIARELRVLHENHSQDLYYEIRKKSYKSKSKRAAKFIYLNRTCWNGLYRVNLKGEFNVPIGTKENVILGSDNFKEVSKILKNTKLIVSDFQEVIDASNKNDFLFIDPPYTVRHNLNGFVKYNDKLFSWDDQIRLRDTIENAVSRGVKVLLTNANHESVKELYKGIGEMIAVERQSVISGNAANRGKYSELIVKTY